VRRDGTKQRISTLAIAVATLAVGFGGAAATRSIGGTTDAAQSTALTPNPRSSATEPRELTSATSPAKAAAVDAELPVPPAPTPVDAIEWLLVAETNGDWSTSFGLLSRSDRSIAPTRARWALAHGQLETIEGFELGAVRSGATRTEVDVVLHLHAELSEVIGLVPATADSTWIAVAEDGGWRVEYGSTDLRPRYPDSADAVAAVRNWSNDRRACHAGVSDTLLGSRAVLDALCATDRRVDVNEVEPLIPGQSTDAFLAAYGPEVFDWARVVPVRSPVALRAVVAPIGDRWRVIGVIEF
jgi:hypothetical protein